MADRLFETLTIGDVKVHHLPEVAYSVKYKSKRKIDEKVADGSSDATATDKGREVRDVTIHLSWPDLPRVNRTMGPILKKLSPGGPDGGKPFDFAHTRNELDLGDINAVRSILIKDCTGPDVEPGSGLCTVEYNCDSWATPSAKAGTGATPGDKDKQGFVLGSELPPHFDPANTTAKTSPTPPDVQP